MLKANPAGYVFNTYSELIAYIAVPERRGEIPSGIQFLIKGNGCTRLLVG